MLYYCERFILTSFNVLLFSIKAFVVLKKDVKATDTLKEDISIYVKKNLAGHAYPKEIEFMDKLPKTRSGKIMRRILKAKELGLPIGDTSTLEEY